MDPLFFFSFLFSLTFSHRNFKAKGAGSFSERQTCAIWLNFYFVLKIYLLIGYLGLNPEDLNFATLMFRYLAWFFTGGCESYFVCGLWWKVRNASISLERVFTVQRSE